MVAEKGVSNMCYHNRNIYVRGILDPFHPSVPFLSRQFEN